MKNKHIAIIGGLATLLLFGHFQSPKDLGPAEDQEEDRQAMQSDLTEESSTGDEETILTPTEETTEICEITQAEQELLESVWNCMEQSDYEGAARVLSDNEEQFQTLFYSTMQAGDWFYDGGQLTARADGTGLVFRRPTAVFYGTIKDGYPQGWGIALKAVRLQAARYDYATGSWNKGMLEGDGISGYCYYEEPDEGELLETKKEGTFHENLLDGLVTYTSVNKEGKVSQWYIEAKGGVTVLDDNWVYKEDKQEYQLLSEGDDTHAYILPEEVMGEATWKNLLVWE